MKNETEQRRLDDGVTAMATPHASPDDIAALEVELAELGRGAVVLQSTDSPGYESIWYALLERMRAVEERCRQLDPAWINPSCRHVQHARRYQLEVSDYLARRGPNWR